MPNITNRLQLRDFRLIQAIYETGQLALAAELLAMTQPAASRMLANIERSIGTPVFARHPKGMTATPVGEILARNAGSLLNELENTFREVEAVGSGRAGTARVGAVTGAAVAFVVPAIKQLKETAIGADIHIDVAPSDALIDGLLKGEYDFVLSRIPAGIDARQFVIRRGRVEVISFMVRSGHPLAGRDGVQLDDLAGYEWIIQAPHTPLRHAVEEAFVSKKIQPPREIVNTTSLLVMIAYMANTDAIGPVVREVAGLLDTGLSGHGLVALEIDEPIIVYPYHLISRRGHLMSPLAIQLRELVFERLQSQD
jgi:DNA-binding transcriptional LysR family regulator